VDLSAVGGGRRRPRCSSPGSASGGISFASRIRVQARYCPAPARPLGRRSGVRLDVKARYQPVPGRYPIGQLCPGKGMRTAVIRVRCVRPGYVARRRSLRPRPRRHARYLIGQAVGDDRAIAADAPIRSVWTGHRTYARRLGVIRTSIRRYHVRSADFDRITRRMA